MSRKSKSKRILAQPDPIYNSRLVTLLIIVAIASIPIVIMPGYKFFKHALEWDPIHSI